MTIIMVHYDYNGRMYLGGNSDSDEVSMDVTGVNISTTFHRHCMHSHCLAANCSSKWQ